MIDTIKNFKLKDFFQQDVKTINEYVLLLQWVEPIPTKNDIFYMKLRDVDFIKSNLGEGDEALIEIIARVQGIENDDVLEMEITKFFGLLNDVKKQIERINHAENVSLSETHPNIKWETVNGSERMAKFGIFNTLDNLAGGDILKYDKIMDITYADVFTKLLMDKTRNDLNIEMSKIKTKENV